MARVPCPIYMSRKSRLRRAFTLVELLVVIAIIGILAALIGNAMNRAKVNAVKAVAVAEQVQMESAIREYRDHLGFYPPDNPNDSVMNPLWFELSGTTNNGVTYVTLDGSAQMTTLQIKATFNCEGFANSSPRAHSTDEGRAPISFLTQLRAKQVAIPDPSRSFIKILSCSAGAPPGANINPWHYVSSNPTHNVGSYDLWVNLVVGGKTFQVNNWTKR